MLRHRNHLNQHRYSLIFAACLACGCTAEAAPSSPVDAIASPLAGSCADGPADLTGDFLDILSSTDPLDPRQEQAYGSASCSGFVFEFLNPDDEPLNGAYVHAGGESSAPGDGLSQAECASRRLDAELWAFSDRRWSRLVATSETGSFEPGALPGTGYCKLEAQLDDSGSYELLRVVASVTQGEQRYPMLALLW